MNAYDQTLVEAIEKFGLNSKCRLPEIVDKKQFLIRWWNRNHLMFNEVTSATKTGKLFNQEHSMVNYHLFRRVKTYEYANNTKEVSEFIETKIIGYGK